MTGAEFRALVSGQRRGLRGSLGRGMLRLCEFPYRAVVSLRNRRYDSGQAEIAQLPIPVVSVGNLTLGGTGKTPMVAWVCQWFRQHATRVAIVSRGYRAQQDGRNDEALELEYRLPDVPHLQDPDRVAAATIAVDELEMELIVLDDGFQHRRLARNLDLVLIDATEPFGFDHVFPRGMLREPVASLARADVVVLTRADMLDNAERQRIERRVRSLGPQATWCEVVHGPQCLLNSQGREQPLSHLRDHSIGAFCGIGNPAGFRHTLTASGYTVARVREFPDHHHYTRDDVEELTRWAQSQRVEALVCTHKDLVKLGVPRLGNVPLWALAVGLEFLTGEEALTSHLHALLDRQRGLKVETKV